MINCPTCKDPYCPTQPGERCVAERILGPERLLAQLMALLEACGCRVIVGPTTLVERGGTHITTIWWEEP